MTGVTDVSGENRLFKRANRTKERTQAPIDWAEKERTKIKLNELVTLAATKDGLVNLRCEKNTEMFTAFVNLFNISVFVDYVEISSIQHQYFTNFHRIG